MAAGWDRVGWKGNERFVCREGRCAAEATKVVHEWTNDVGSDAEN
jgi:hypothetical protein